ncbi:MAG: peptidase U32 family protein [Nanobdellota archaeon]
MMNEEIEIMAPAGSFESLRAAINSGAKSVYFGLGNLNMRSRSANFKEEDLPKISEICRKNKIISYLTLNTILYDEDIENAKKLCDEAKKNKINAIIASDISIITYAKKIGLEVHLSTQCNISNFEAVKFYSQYADVIVLARELNLNQIKEICDKIQENDIKGPSGKRLRIELFIHGALCVAISGKCYMSLAQYNKSANRGACLQACRRSYIVKDEETGDELKIENKYIMSPKDLCTIKILDKIIEAGVKVLKIEGRGRNAEYVDKVVKVYHDALKDINKKTYTKNKKEKYEEELKKVFNRGFWNGGYYLGSSTGEWSGIYGSKAKEKKISLGVVKNYFKEKSVGEFRIYTNDLKKGDQVMITGPTTGVYRAEVKEMRKDGQSIEKAEKGDIITFITNKKLRKNDKIFKIIKNG